VVEDVQAQADDVVTVIVPAAPVAGVIRKSGLTENEHDTLGSVTTNVLPAIVSVADLGLVVVLAAPVNATLPEPVPLAPLPIVTHDAPLVAVQLQPAVVVTSTEPLPPAADSDWLVADIANEHGGAAWVTVNVLPPTLSVAVRERGPVFAVIE
jgi:hypothetical protein